MTKAVGMYIPTVWQCYIEVLQVSDLVTYMWTSRNVAQQSVDRTVLELMV